MQHCQQVRSSKALIQMQKKTPRYQFVVEGEQGRSREPGAWGADLDEACESAERCRKVGLASILVPFSVVDHCGYLEEW